MANGERAYWAAWHCLPGVGSVTIKRLSEHFGSLEAAWWADEAILSTADGWTERKGLVALSQRHSLDPQRLLSRLEERWPAFVTPADSAYPPLLREIPDPPPLLFFEGPLRSWPPAVAIVGTRQPTAYGLRYAGRIAEALARAGFVVVSGLALGIDGTAHRGALRHGLTAAVLGSSLDQIYPCEHRGLASEVAQGGLLLSEHPPGTETQPHFFPRRNRIVVGMSLATILIEAPIKSGALISARLACEYNREVFVLPGSLDTLQAAGGLKLLAQGANPILSVEGLLDDLSRHLVRSVLPPLPLQLPTLNLVEQQIWDSLGPDCLSFDALSERTQLSIGDLAGGLLSLEMQGLIAQQAGSCYCRL